MKKYRLSVAKNKRNYGVRKIGFEDMAGTTRLANEIVLQAIEDWKMLDAGCLENHDRSYAALRSFFKSDWCDLLLTVMKADFCGADILKWLEEKREI